MSKRKVVQSVPPSAPPGERNGRPPIEAIRAAAFRQFAERGYPVVTVRDIMKACGLTQGALYNHFKSRTSCCTTSSPRRRPSSSDSASRR